LHSFPVRLSSTKEVAAFVQTVDLFRHEVTVLSKGASVSGKSMMGILSLNLKHVLTVETDCSHEELSQLKSALSAFVQ
jgi:phosphotransferase system HPr-like phosphotransfer protein